MRLYRNKKSQKTFLVYALIAIAGFALILLILNNFSSQAEAKTVESVCKASVVLRENTYTEIKDPVTGKLPLGSVASPLLCRTIDKRLPEDNKATKEQIKKDFAQLSASCWNQFGEGLIADVFKKGDPYKNSCFVCYTVSLRETSDFNKNSEIKSAELLQYFFGNTYKILGKGTKCEDSNGLCRTSNPDTSLYAQQDSLKCQSSRERCFVENSKVYSYGEYIESFGGKGKIIIGDDIRPGETYAVSFGSPTDKCDWCSRVGIGSGAGAAAGTFIAITMAAGTGPIGWTLGGIGALASGTIFYTGAKEAAVSAAIILRDLFSERKFSTIYITTLKQVNEGGLCSVISE